MTVLRIRNKLNEPRLQEWSILALLSYLLCFSAAQIVDSGRHDMLTLQKRRSTSTSTFLLRHVLHQNNANEPEALHLFNLPTPAEQSLAANDDKSVHPYPWVVRSKPMKIQRPHTGPERIKALLGHGENPDRLDAIQVQWITQTVLGPNVSDKETLINLAKMSSDAYILDPSQPDWLNISLGFNHSSKFGWQSDGLRGHVFANSNNRTVIIAYKGTSVDPRDGLTSKDRLNDNLLFSCCCATQRPDPYWYGQVCDCRKDVFQCNSTCLTYELARKDRYYATAMQVFQNVTLSYPNSQIWTTGHSMGGAMASLIGLTYNVPAVTFESLPQRLPAERLGLAIPPDPGLTGAFHFGHTADPVYMGACNGFFSSCAIGGFAFESQCFTGLRCAYDTVGDLGWRMGINTHRINNVIHDVLETYDTVANCTLDEECAECNNWFFSTDQIRETFP